MLRIFPFRVFSVFRGRHHRLAESTNLCLPRDGMPAALWLVLKPASALRFAGRLRALAEFVAENAEVLAVFLTTAKETKDTKNQKRLRYESSLFRVFSVFRGCLHRLAQSATYVFFVMPQPKSSVAQASESRQPVQELASDQCGNYQRRLSQLNLHPVCSLPRLH